MNANEYRLISSQRYLDSDRVAEKQADQDYDVVIGRAIEIDGYECHIVIDGHHSLAAAALDGVVPNIRIATETESDREGIDDLDDYLESHWMDSDWYYIADGSLVF